MNECRYMYGCALESRLEPGQCFIRYQVVDKDGKPFENPKFETVTGQIIVTKILGKFSMLFQNLHFKIFS